MKTKMTCVLHNKDPLALAKNMMSYFKQTQPDCILYSQDDCKVLVHKELLYQTKYMRSMIQSAADVIYSSSLEIMCPNLSSSELEAIVQFLYCGKISCSDEVFAN